MHTQTVPDGTAKNYEIGSRVNIFWLATDLQVGSCKSTQVNLSFSSQVKSICNSVTVGISWSRRFITSRSSRPESDYLTNKLAQKSLGIRVILWSSRTPLFGTPLLTMVDGVLRLWTEEWSIKVKQRSWVLLDWGWQTHSLWTAEGSPAICSTCSQNWLVLSRLIMAWYITSLHSLNTPQSLLWVKVSFTGSSYSIQQCLPYHIMMTDAVRIATLVDPSEQQEK